MSRRRSTSDVDPARFEPLRVLIADADREFATAMERVLRKDPMVDLVEVVTSARDAVESVERLVPHIAVVGELPESDLGDLTTSIGRAGRVAVVRLVRPEWDESLAPPEIQAVAFLRRESSAERTLEGFSEIAAFAVASQIGRSAEDA